MSDADPVRLAACISAIQGAFCAMQTSGVWLGALWWAAGPWWGTVSTLDDCLLGLFSPRRMQYYQSIEPPNGAAIAQSLPQAMIPFL